jgi:hypothetical protein
MIEILVTLMAIAGSVLTLLGLFVFVWVFIMPKDLPMDESNRINHLRLVWFCLIKPQYFATLHEEVVLPDPEDPEHAVAYYYPAFPWLLLDEGEVVGLSEHGVPNYDD